MVWGAVCSRVLFLTFEKLMKPITSQKLNFDSADAQYGSSIINTNVIVSDNGQVVWLSHGIFRSSCDINVEFFPFDIQSCKMKWASWTYDGYQVSSIKLIQFYINSLFHQVTRLRSSSGAIKVNCCFWESNFIKKLSVVRLAVWSFHTRLTFDGCPDSFFLFLVHGAFGWRAAVVSVGLRCLNA